MTWTFFYNDSDGSPAQPDLTQIFVAFQYFPLVNEIERIMLVKAMEPSCQETRGTSAMKSVVEPIVLIAREGALISVVCARLIMAGDTPITAGDFDDPQLEPALRSSAILVVEGKRLSPEPGQAVHALRAMGWNGKLAVILDRLPEAEPPARVRWVAKTGGTPAIMAAIATLRAL